MRETNRCEPIFSIIMIRSQQMAINQEQAALVSFLLFFHNNKKANVQKTTENIDRNQHFHNKKKRNKEIYCSH